LQTIADELNRDALASDTSSERWIIVQTAIRQSLQEVEARS
jgi:predicted transcriptional regulator